MGRGAGVGYGGPAVAAVAGSRPRASLSVSQGGSCDGPREAVSADDDGAHSDRPDRRACCSDHCLRGS
ncbi:hypothetical protein JYU34_011036 [Plutella xylostella]|uniref:Uncharacterized protein n=1 Tax=Plutella xylostella TaxID=51655 RepID=A0ABQ7QFZ9_PLUXY|nr:hypothetical protein JYU34_011036 [Plutella xylostella]